ncbi:MAG: hypothetical protein U1F16_08100 [Turneriella sp.]
MTSLSSPRDLPDQPLARPAAADLGADSMGGDFNFDAPATEPAADFGALGAEAPIGAEAPGLDDFALPDATPVADTPAAEPDMKQLRVCARRAGRFV